MQIQHINNRYKIIKQLGEGGMGSVLLAEDLANSNRLTAIKTIKPKFLENPESLAHFKHEYEVMSKLWHPNLAQVYDFGELDDGGYYLAMEYINGRELNLVIRQDVKMEFDATLAIIVHLLRAMEFVHSRNIIYCDIKPQNILVTDDNQAKLIDFGLSDFGHESSKDVKGTMKYIAPEVINGKEKDHRADIFSLGVLFYEMLSGELFYKDDSVSSIISKLKSNIEFKTVVDIAFENLKDSRTRAIIQKMCAFIPRDRFSSCAEVIIGLNTALNLKIPIETEETKEAFVTGVSFTAREKELDFLEKFLASDENKLLLITGKQGVGRSRLLTEFHKQCNLNGSIFLQGNSLRGESYEAFIIIISEILFLYNDKISEQRKIYLKNLLPDHPVLLPIIPDEKEIMDAKTLKEVLVQTISAIIIDYSKSVRNIVVLVLNDFNNTDEISLDIVDEILYKIKTSKLDNLKILAECRSEEQQDIADFLVRLKDKDRLKVIKIAEFSEKEVTAYINNTFGARFLGRSLSEKVAEIFKYCGGNPFFLQELLKSLVAEGTINKEGSQWQFKGSLAGAKINTGIRSIVKKRIDNLKLPELYLKGLILICFAKQEKLFVEFFQQYAQAEIDIKWQSLFDLLVKKEFLISRDGYFATTNQLFKEVIFSSIKQDETIEYHRLWAKILEKKLPNNANVEEIDNNLLYDLGYHYQNSKFTEIDLFLDKTARFLFEMGKREKAKYANKKAIVYLSRLLKELERFDQHSDEILKLRADIYLNLAVVNELLGKWDKAEELYQNALGLADKIDDSKSFIDCKCYLGWLILNKGRYDEALAIFSEVGAIAKANGDKKTDAIVLGSMGNIYSDNGDHDKAMQCFEEKKQLCLELGDKSGYCGAVGSMGNVYCDKGDYDKGLQCYQEQKQINLEIGDKRAYSGVVGNMGIFFKEKGDYNQAMSCYQEYKQISKELGDVRGYSIAVGHIGTVYSDKGEYDQAMQCYEEKKNICLELGDKRGYSIAIYNMANVIKEKGDFSKAMQFYDEAISIGRELQVKYFLCFYLSSKSDLLFTLKDYDNAKLLNQEANSISTEIANKDIIFKTTILSCKLIALYKPTEAISKLTQMLESETEISNSALVHYEIYKINRSTEHQQKALDICQQLYEKTPNIEYKNRIDELTNGAYNA